MIPFRIKSLFFVLISMPVLATNLQQQTNALINHVDPDIKISAKVVDLNTGETLFERQATLPLIPASNMKLFSDAAALLALGPNYRFKTQLFTDARSVSHGVLNGSLYLYLPGDPSFKTSHLNQLLAALSPWGIEQINGNVVLISDHRDVDAFAPGWKPEDRGLSYSAPLSPLILDENRLTVTVNPGSIQNKTALIELSDHDHAIGVNNHVKTTNQPRACGLSFIMDRTNNLNVQGCIGLGAWAYVHRIAIQNPLHYAEAKIKAHLALLGIVLNGQVILGNYPQHAVLIATHRSKPITQLMIDTLKPSDNLYADSLYLHAANVLNGSALNWLQAETVIKQFLQQQTGIELSQAILTDGSGLSRRDRLCAKQTVDLLAFLYRKFPLAYEYIAALPIAGLDGTLERRLKKPNQQGFIRAKTGSMSGVTSLSGYLYTANAHTLAFAFYINQKPSTKPQVAGRYRALIDQLCDFFLRQNPDNRTVTSQHDAHALVAYQHPRKSQPLQPWQPNRWRPLEHAIKQALTGKAVDVVYRNNQLILHDKCPNTDTVWHALQTIYQQHPFAVTLQSSNQPTTTPNSPWLLWMNTPNNTHEREWALRMTLSPPHTNG